MNTKKISESEIADLKVSSLPTRPTSSRANGGRGFSASEMKAAFDSLPLYIIKRLNSLIEDIEGVGEGSLASSLKTGIEDGHTLKDLFDEIGSGNLIYRLGFEDESLGSYVAKLKSEYDDIKEQIEELALKLEFPDTQVLDLGKVTDVERPYAICAYRGTRKEWENSNLVLADGEIATEINDNGTVRFKIGDGKHVYPDLKYTDSMVVVGPEAMGDWFSLTVENGLDIRLGEVEEINFCRPLTIDENFHCKVSFECGENGTLLMYDYIDFHFTGTHCTDGYFGAQTNYHYTVYFYNGGRVGLEGIVRGSRTDV